VATLRELAMEESRVEARGPPRLITLNRPERRRAGTTRGDPEGAAGAVLTGSLSAMLLASCLKGVERWGKKKI
jgi:hypothetical protein